MLTILAYVLVIPISQICLGVGMWLTGIPVAFLLAWTSVSIRSKIAGFIGGEKGTGDLIPRPRRLNYQNKAENHRVGGGSIGCMPQLQLAPYPVQWQHDRD